MKLIVYIGPYVKIIDDVLNETVIDYKDRLHISTRMELCSDLLEQFFKISNDDVLSIVLTNFLSSCLWSESYPYVDAYDKVSDLIIFYLKNHRECSLFRELCLDVETYETCFKIKLKDVNNE